MSDRAYTIEPFPPFQQLIIDGLEFASSKHKIHGLVEVDVSRARQRLREIRDETGEMLSLTGFIIYRCARAVDEDRHVHAYRDWRNRLVLFDEVDVCVPVERPAGSQYESLQIVIRGANRKSVRQIHQEIRQAQSKGLDETPWRRNLRWYTAVPAIVRRSVFRLISRAPHLIKRLNGTIMVTSVGMFGAGAGWGIPLIGHTLCITVGGIVARPAVADGRIVEKEHLCLTVSFDHDIVDGAPAARFVHRLREFVESANGLFAE